MQFSAQAAAELAAENKRLRDRIAELEAELAHNCRTSIAPNPGAGPLCAHSETRVNGGVWLCDPDGVPQFWEKNFLAEDLGPLRAKWSQCCATGEPWEHEYRINHDGAMFTVLSKGLPVRDAEGKITCWVGVDLDITAHKRLDEELRQRVEELETIAELTPVAIWVAYDPECRHIAGNRAANLLFEAGPGDYVWTTISPDLRRYFQDGRELTPEEMPMQQAVARNAEIRDAEVEVLLPSGKRIHLLGNASPLRDASGNIRGCIGACLDITGHLRSEERLRNAQKLESIGLLAGGIAHDFNNLLTGIMGNASLIVDDMTPEAEEKVRNIIASAERAADLTRQLLAYSGKGQFHARDLDLTEVLRQMESLLRRSIPEPVELRLDLQNELPLVKMDPGQLHQIVMNLAVNAGEAIGDRPGSISVSNGVRDVETAIRDVFGQEIAPGRYVYVQVADSGPGIEESEISRIFEPFFTTKFAGRGLGLAAVAGIIRTLGGAIVVDSAPGRGASFQMMLRLAYERKVAPKLRKPDSKGSILVVDDDIPVRRFMTNALQNAGYEVTEAGDGAEALFLCANGHTFDAVIVDLVMPVMGGGDFVQEITKLRKDVRVLLTSGYDELEARRLCAPLESAGFIQKPYTARQLLQAVELLSKTAFSPS